MENPFYSAWSSSSSSSAEDGSRDGSTRYVYPRGRASLEPLRSTSMVTVMAFTTATALACTFLALHYLVLNPHYRYLSQCKTNYFAQAAVAVPFLLLYSDLFYWCLLMFGGDPFDFETCRTYTTAISIGHITGLTLERFKEFSAVPSLMTWYSTRARRFWLACNYAGLVAAVVMLANSYASNVVAAVYVRGDLPPLRKFTLSLVFAWGEVVCTVMTLVGLVIVVRRIRPAVRAAYADTAKRLRTATAVEPATTDSLTRQLQRLQLANGEANMLAVALTLTLVCLSVESGMLWGSAAMLGQRVASLFLRVHLFCALVGWHLMPAVAKSYARVQRTGDSNKSG
ncbi:hypothetical protein RI367_008716 [Sorochytrium milnesiophthora]